MISPEPSLFTAMFRREITSAKGTSVSNLTSFAVNGITVFDMYEYREFDRLKSIRNAKCR